MDVERAEGVYIYDTNGKRYTDLISGIAVNNLGHRHPRVTDAIKQQVDKYLHVIPYGEFVQAPQVALAQKLQELLPDGLDSSYFVNSGTEANEGALKLAKRYTGRSELISCQKSYHGSTHGALSVSGNEEKKHHVRPLLPDVHFMRFGEVADLHMISSRTAAVIIEPIQGDAGVRIPSQAYMKALRERCTETGALLIFDEIQTGSGRTGALFAFMDMEVRPDILTTAKAFGGGMPMGVFISSKEIMQSLSHDPVLGHITTFGGHPVCCAAALANLEVLTEGDLIKNVESKGALFEELLAHSKVKEIRRKGMMMAIELENPEQVIRMVDRCMDLGVIIFYFLSTRNAFRVQPPLTISEAETREACAVISTALDEL